jgi:hypothetical protein
MWFLGIDPGKNGSIVWFDDDTRTVHPLKMPVTRDDMWQAIRHPPIEACVPPESVNAVVEWIGTPPRKPREGKDDKPEFATSLQSYGGVREAFGACEAFVVAAGYRRQSVPALTWQRVMGVRKPRGKKETQTEKKNRHKQVAQGLFPDVTVTHALEDGLLLVEYCRRVMG